MLGMRSRRHSNEAAIFKLLVERLGEKKHSSDSFTANLCLSRLTSLGGGEGRGTRIREAKQSKAKLLELLQYVPHSDGHEMGDHTNVENAHEEVMYSRPVQ